MKPRVERGFASETLGQGVKEFQPAKRATVPGSDHATARFAGSKISYICSLGLRSQSLAPP